MAELTRLWTPDEEGRKIPNVAIALSGSGSNAVRIIEYQLERLEQTGEAPYHVAFLFSDNPTSNCAYIVQHFKEKHGFKLENFIFDIKAFYKRRGMPLKDMEVRREYDEIVNDTYDELEIDFEVLAGYMKAITDIRTDARLVMNVHPADLRKVDESGNRKYTGANAVRLAILDGATELRSSVHVVEYNNIDPTHLVDKGAIIAVSYGFEPVVLPFGFDYRNLEWVKTHSELIDQVSGEHQDKLKLVSDLKVYLASLEFIATQNVSTDLTVPKGRRIIYLDGNPMPEGVMLGA